MIPVQSHGICAIIRLTEADAEAKRDITKNENDYSNITIYTRTFREVLTIFRSIVRVREVRKRILYFYNGVLFISCALFIRSRDPRDVHSRARENKKH